MSSDKNMTGSRIVKAAAVTCNKPSTARSSGVRRKISSGTRFNSPSDQPDGIAKKSQRRCLYGATSNRSIATNEKVSESGSTTKSNKNILVLAKSRAMTKAVEVDGFDDINRSSKKLAVCLQDIEDSANTCQVPINFDKAWNLILKMRQDWDAPVDIMGCDKLAYETSNHVIRRFHHLVACFLSSQTSDQCTSACMERLNSFGLTPSNILHHCTIEELGAVLKGVSFHNTKAKNLKKICQIIQDEYDGDIPNTYEGLCRLPGIGPKMALIVMNVAWGQVQGIATDVHVHRISNRLGWIRTKTPEETCVALSAVIPRELWSDYNRVLVGFGQQVCKALHPQCSRCELNKLCPSAKIRSDARKIFSKRITSSKSVPILLPSASNDNLSIPLVK